MSTSTSTVVAHTSESDGFTPAKGKTPAKTPAKGETVATLSYADLLPRTIERFGSLSDVEASIRSLETQRIESSAAFRAWVTVAVAARQSGVTVRQWGEDTGTSSQALTRLYRAGEVFHALGKRANDVDPLAVRTYANNVGQSRKGSVTPAQHTAILKSLAKGSALDGAVKSARKSISATSKGETDTETGETATTAGKSARKSDRTDANVTVDVKRMAATLETILANVAKVPAKDRERALAAANGIVAALSGE